MSTHVIVGAGQAGAAAALQMRRSGFGGRVVLIGDEPHLPYERPPLSKAVLTDPAPVLPALGKQETYEAADVELLTGTAVAALDPDTKEVALANGGRLAFDRLLLALRREHVTSAGRHQHIVLDPDSTPPRDIGAGLDSKHHPGQQRDL